MKVIGISCAARWCRAIFRLIQSKTRNIDVSSIEKSRDLNIRDEEGHDNDKEGKKGRSTADSPEPHISLNRQQTRDGDIVRHSRCRLEHVASELGMESWRNISIRIKKVEGDYAAGSVSIATVELQRERVRTYRGVHFDSMSWTTPASLTRISV